MTAIELTISPTEGVCIDGLPLNGIMRLIHENDRWVIWRSALYLDRVRARARDVTAIIDNQEALRKIASKMLAEIGVSTAEELLGKFEYVETRNGSINWRPRAVASSKSK